MPGGSVNPLVNDSLSAIFFTFYLLCHPYNCEKSHKHIASPLVLFIAIQRKLEYSFMFSASQAGLRPSSG
jgi:hypothetical protein